MNTSLRLTKRDLEEMDCIGLYGNIAYEINSPMWTRLKQLQQADLVTVVSSQNIIGYQGTECFELTDKGRRVLKGGQTK